MGFARITSLDVRIDKYTRSSNAVASSMTQVPKKDIVSVSFNLPNARTVDVTGLAEEYIYMVKNGKFEVSNAVIELRLDVDESTGVPLANSGVTIVGRPEPANAPTRTIEIALTAGLKMTWEVNVESMEPTGLDADGVQVFTATLYNASNVAPTITGI